MMETEFEGGMKSDLRLSRLLEKNKKQIIAAWVDCIREELDEPSSTSDTELADHMAYVIDAIIKELYRLDNHPLEDGTTQVDTMDFENQEIHDEEGSGAIHGRQRAGINAYNADKVYWEYVMLRKIIFQHARANDVLDIERLEVINRVIESSARDSLLMFSKTLQKVQRKLLGSIVHDIRSPLNTISMVSQLANQDVAASQGLDVAKTIQSSADRINNMLESMLHTLSYEAGQGLELQFDNGDIVALLREVSHQAKRIYGERLQINLPTQVIETPHDEQIITRVIENLLSNAFKYGDRDSDVTLTLEDTEHAVFISVHNFGAPIPARHQLEIFQFMKRFEGQRDQGQAKELKKSWGIGLAFSHAAITGHKGLISVKSDDTNGTTFVIELPRNTLEAGQSTIVSM